MRDVKTPCDETISFGQFKPRKEDSTSSDSIVLHPPPSAMVSLSVSVFC